MPPLVMKEPQGGILNQTNKLIVHRQIQYGRSKRVPWGISEAAYNARDREMTYQYTNFGVPGLGLKRGLAQNTVIAPYATILAAQFMPHEAMRNLDRLQGDRRTRPLRVPRRGGLHAAARAEGTDHAVVYNYYAHHQGMSIVAVANAIFEGRMRDRFHSDPVIEAAELLLQEKAPRHIPVATVRTEADDEVGVEEDESLNDSRHHPQPGACAARHQRDVQRPLFGHGHGAAAPATAAGRILPITRWRGDPVRRTATAPSSSCATSKASDWWSATGRAPRRGREGLCAFQRRQGDLRQNRRHAALGGRVHRRVRG